MSKKYFQPVRMESMYLSSKLHTVYVRDGATAVAVNDGDLVVLTNEFLKDEVYTNAYQRAQASHADVTDFNTRVAQYPGEGATDVCIVDLADVATAGNGSDLVYRIGVRTIGLTKEAGKWVRARKLVKDDTFRVGAENFATAPVVGQYATTTDDSPLFTPAATAPAAGLSCVVVEKTTVSQGINANVTSYLMLVVRN